MAEKLPPEISPSENFQTTLTRAEDFLREFESSSVPSSLTFEQQRASSTLASTLPEHRIEGNNEAAAVDQSQEGGNVLQESNRSSVPNTEAAMPPESSESSRSLHPSRSVREGETEVTEQFEPGVYVTLVVKPDGNKVFKQVRFRYYNFFVHKA